MTNKKETASPPGIRDWRSYAYLRAGARWMRRDEEEEARRMFSRALRYDEKNWGALFNLGTLDLSSEPKDYERALRRLREAKRGVEKQYGKYKNRNPVWYKAVYQLAAAYSYEAAACSCEDNPCPSAKKALEEVDELTRTIRETLEETDKVLQKRWKRRQKRSARELRRFLKDFKPLAEILHAGILVENNDFTEAQKKVSEVEKEIKKARFSYRARYNLACYYSRRAGKEDPPNPQSPFYEKALYNLEYALERDHNLTRWATKDPALETLHQDGASKRKFDELIEKYAAPTLSKAKDRLPLADLAAIGETYAALLKEHGISSRDDLIRKADTREAQQTLAEELGIDVSLVRRWALLTDLLRIVGLDVPSANLLEASDVRSIRQLSNSNPEKLTRLLGQVNRGRSLVKETPSEETLRRWITDARNTTLPKVYDGRRWWRWAGRFP